MDKYTFIDTDYFVDNKYLDKYLELIASNANTSESTTTQIHHILPRCYFVLTQNPLDDSDDNRVVLEYKDHILAHYYLCLCATNNLKYKLENAFLMLSNLKRVPDFRPNELTHYTEIYESCISARKGVAPPNKGKPMSEEQKRKISNSLRGHSVSDSSRIKMREAQLNMSAEKRMNITLGTQNRNYVPSIETRAKMSKSQLGHTVSTETRAKIGASNKKQRGQKWYTNGIECVLLCPGDCVPEGFHRGTLRKGKHWYNNGVKEILTLTPPEGFVQGRLTNEKQ